MSKSTVFILAGGAGTRLKPLSLTGKGKLPKQFLRLFGKGTLLQEAIKRIPSGHSVVIVPEAVYSDEVNKQAGEIGAQVEIFPEPFGCNTAAAVIASAAKTAILDNDPSRVICFLPADHMMDVHVFRKLFDQAVERARAAESIITIGITPTRPDTGYGYIKTEALHDHPVMKVRRFVEKPDRETALRYIESGDYFWNAGIFIGKARLFLELSRVHSPEIVQSVEKHMSSAGFDITAAYEEIKREKNTLSIDYALMEKIPEHIELVKASQDLGWNDLGSWESIAPFLESDCEHNHWLAESPPALDHVKDFMVCNYTDLPVQVKDVSGLVVVVTKHGILIRPKNS